MLSAHACTILEFGAENLLYPSQNIPETVFQELEAFAANGFPIQPIFAGHVRFKKNLDAPIDLGKFDFAAVHYAPGTSGDPTLNLGGSLDFFFIGGASPCCFTFPQIGPGDTFSNGHITSVMLFHSEPIPEAGATAVLFAIALSALGTIRRFAKN